MGAPGIHGRSMNPYDHVNRSFNSDISLLGLFKLLAYIYFVFSYFQILLSFFRKEKNPKDKS
jgi:hypothetical protein